MIYLDQVTRGTRFLDKKSFNAQSSETVSYSDTNATIYFSITEKVSMANLKPIKIISSRKTPLPQSVAASSSSIERQLDTMISTSA